MDMGFTHEAARLALLNTGSLEEATDYILNHPHAPPARVILIMMNLNDSYPQNELLGNLLRLSCSALGL